MTGRAFVVRDLRKHPVLWLLGLLVPLSGCGDSSPGKEGADPKGQMVKVVPREDLPPLGDSLPLMDDGRVELAGPIRWIVESRKQERLACFRKVRGQLFPAIVVTVEEWGNSFNVTRENVAKFAARISKGEEDGRTVTPIVIGPFIGAEYTKGAKVEGRYRPAELLRLVTVVNGRKYTVELRAWEGELEDARMELYAVAAGMRFLEAEGEETERVQP